MNRTLTTLLLSFLSSLLFAQEVRIWAAPDGSDTNAGTMEKPLASLQMALRQVHELRRLSDLSGTQGAHIYLRNGLYVLSEPVFIRPEDSGTSTSPTIIDAAPNEKPILSGGVAVTGWQKVKGSVAGLPRETAGKVWVANAPKVGSRLLEFTRTLNAMRNNKVEANRIHHFAKHMYDAAAIYTLSAQPGSTIAKNYIDSIYKAPYAHLPAHWFYLYTDEGSSYFTIKDNWTPSEKFLQNANGPNNVWEHNGPQVADSIKVNAGLQAPYRYLLTSQTRPDPNWSINKENPVIIELITSDNQSIAIQKLKQVSGTLSTQAQPPGRHPLTLWYKQPAKQWVEALPIGNGRLGGMVFGDTQEDHIQFNESTLWTGEPREYQREGAAQYLPQIRQLLADGKQAEAEKLAQEKFMGRQSNEADYAQKKEAWFANVRDLRKVALNPTSPTLDNRAWKTMAVPTVDGWEKAGLEGLDGAVWFRTSFELPQSWLGKDVILDMGRIRDQDFTYLNGEFIGTSEGIMKNRRYQIPASKLHAGTNQLAIQVINLFDKGGFIGAKTNQPTFVVYPVGQQPTNGVPLRQPFRYWIQDDNPPAAPRYQADYQPFGDVWLRFKRQENITNYRRELDLTTALTRVTYSASGVTFTRDYLASAPDQVIAIHLTADKPGKISFEASLASPHKKSSVRQLDKQTIALSVQVSNGALKGESLLHIQTQKGQVTVSEGKLIVSGADEATVYLTAGTNFKNYKDVSGYPATMSQRPLQALRAKRFDALKVAHVRDYQSYFNTLTLDLGASPNENLPTDERLQTFEKSNDPALAALYLQYGRYLLISSSRPSASPSGRNSVPSQPANLQGIWNDLLTPPWGSKYTTNINLEMNYWPAEMLNLSACHEPLFAAIDELVESGRKTAKAHYNARGWVLHHNTDLWRGTAPINASNHGIWVSGGAWVSHHLWEHYRYTQDQTFLAKRAYPAMKEAAQFFVDFLVKDPKTGWLISTPSNSPEHGGLVAGPTMDHQIIRDLFKNCIAASKILGTDVAFRDTLQSMYRQIAPNQIGKHGQLQEWLQDIDDPKDTHRHVSHLWGVHPGTDITWEETPDLMKAARQSLLERGDDGTGWSLAWKINFWARFRDGNHAYNMLKLLFRPAISPEGTTGGGSYPNLFDAHPPFQIDGNFGGSSGIAEMLLQSQGKTLDLLPALPFALPTGYINGICAQGGFILNIRWKNGQLSGVDITSKAGQPCVLRYGDKQLHLKTEKGKTYKLNGDLTVL